MNPYIPECPYSFLCMLPAFRLPETTVRFRRGLPVFVQIPEYVVPTIFFSNSYAIITLYYLAYAHAALKILLLSVLSVKEENAIPGDCMWIVKIFYVTFLSSIRYQDTLAFDAGKLMFRKTAGKRIGTFFADCAGLGRKCKVWFVPFIKFTAQRMYNFFMLWSGSKCFFHIIDVFHFCQSSKEQCVFIRSTVLSAIFNLPGCRRAGPGLSITGTLCPTYVPYLLRKNNLIAFQKTILTNRIFRKQISTFCKKRASVSEFSMIFHLAFRLFHIDACLFLHKCVLQTVFFYRKHFDL